MYILSILTLNYYNKLIIFLLLKLTNMITLYFQKKVQLQRIILEYY